MKIQKSQNNSSSNRASAHNTSVRAHSNTSKTINPTQLLQDKLQAMVDAAPKNKQAAQLQIMANEFADKSVKFTERKSTSSEGVVQRFDATQKGFDAAIKVVEYSGMTPSMIAQGYEPILDADQKKAIGHLRELKNLFRFKEQLDERSDARKYTSQALSLISNIDPTGITGALSKIEDALAKMQLAKRMYDEHNEGSAVPLAGVGAASPGDSYGSGK